MNETMMIQLLERLVLTLEKQTELQRIQYEDYASAHKLSKENNEKYEARIKVNDAETKKNNEASLLALQNAVNNQNEIVKLNSELIRLQNRSISILEQINERGK